MSIRRRDFIKRFGQGSLAVGALAAGCTPAARPAWEPAFARSDDDFWKMVRNQYPLAHDPVYLNTGGLGPAPYRVMDAVQRTMMQLQTVPETGYRLIEEARAPVAAFFGAHPNELAFMRNATEANSTIASGLRMTRGDEVIFESHAHPGGSLPWMNRQKQDGVRVRIFEPDTESLAGNLERIEALITPRTRAIQVSHVTAPTGIRFPVAEIARLARDRGIWFHIDGAQSAGMFGFDLHAIGCDSYAASGHKWMGAPHGTGVLYLREDRLEEIAPTEVGAYSDDGVELPDVFNYHPSARRFEPGTRDAAQILGIRIAAEFLTEIGLDRVEAYGMRLAAYLQEGLRQIPGVTVLTPSNPALAGAITTYRTDRVPYDALFRYLFAEHRLRARVVSEQGIDALRVSTHIFNNIDHCDRVIAATRAALNQA
jgi:selenocysteine lyase/cysteine desulfurase